MTFARPAKFSKRTFKNTRDNFLNILHVYFATNLQAYLRKSVSVDVVNSEVIAIYSEFSNALSNPVLLGVISMNPLVGNCIMEMASNLGYSIIDRLLGGPGAAIDKQKRVF